ncbi:hypothetical protein HELRODRAFT_163437 [Helobdella robusta]|uniref:RING-type E3 ubiquitin transferase n=1 Tax=Helobdella robusta TaxID=6412 RepID=T1EU17_HELRO|nr:hypothetical protein HELRODRAFT_163437 [Helobdella robusta]ESN96379.1 hypothetical protein HELRODRAFT_163437 [Helobdella robusta]
MFTSHSDANLCTICLSVIRPKDRSLISMCLHEFCFSCIKEWSKQNAVCPLCKQNFSEILHKIRSDANYDIYEVTRPTHTEQRSFRDEVFSSTTLVTSVSSFTFVSRVESRSVGADDLSSDPTAVTSRTHHNDTPDATRPALTTRRLFNRMIVVYSMYSCDIAILVYLFNLLYLFIL